MGVTKQQLLNTIIQLKQYIDNTPSTVNLLSNYLSKTNTTEYTPTKNYHPTTKKYVDDVTKNAKVKISTQENNAIEQKEDGLFVSNSGIGNFNYCSNEEITQMISKIWSE